jgi:hypothetical protein
MKQTIYIAGAFAIGCLLHKYTSVKYAYGKAEAEKVSYCKKYYEQEKTIENMKYTMQWQDSIIEFLHDDNQLLSSYLAETEMQ